MRIKIGYWNELDEYLAYRKDKMHYIDIKINRYSIRIKLFNKVINARRLGLLPFTPKGIKIGKWIILNKTNETQTNKRI